MPLRSPNHMDCTVSPNMPKNCQLHQLPVRGDDRGSLIALESGYEVPFDIARIYYIFGTTEGVDRGFHAHERLTQWAICVSGSCVMHLDDGTTKADITLDRPDLAVEIGSIIWREMRDFSPGAVLLVLASAPYSIDDYIRDYDQFLVKARG